MSEDLSRLLGYISVFDFTSARRYAASLLSNERAGGPNASANVNLAGANMQGWTALHFACALGGCTGLSGSIAEGSPTPTTAALATGILADVGFLLEAESTQLKHTPLHVAAAGGAGACASELLARGARLQAADDFGHTALHLAAAAGFRGMLELLLQAALQRETLEFATACDKEGRTPLSVAQAAGNQKCAEVLQRFLSRHLSSSTVSEGEVVLLTKWLEEEVKLPAYIDGFISLGYTRLDLWAELGLSAEDYEQIGVKAPAHRTQISHYLKKYAQENKQSSSSEEESSDDEDNSDEDDDDLSSEEESD